MSVRQVLASRGRALESSLREEMEARFQHDFSRVRVHADARASRSAEDIGAEAYSFGPHIVLAEGRYPPSGARELRLLSHELAHVIQQPAAAPGTPLLADAHDPREAAADRAAALASGRISPGRDLGVAGAGPAAVLRKASDRHRFRLLAAQVYDAIYGLGTDEEAVYQALQELDRDEAAIRFFMKVYRSYVAEQERESVEKLPADQLVVDIEGDFSGSEKDYALALINRAEKDADVRIEATAPTSGSPLEAAARRLWDAVETWEGTDEEAIYSVLLPFGRDQSKLNLLRHAYTEVAKANSGEAESLDDRILDEMSGSELDYAIYLLFSPDRAYQHYLREASDVLSSMVSGGQRTMGSECFDTKDDAFDQDYWKADIPGENEMCALLARTADRPSLAVKALFDSLTSFAGGSWKVDCAEWVQIHHLYAMLKLLGPYRFDLQFGVASGKVPFALKEHRSTGLTTRSLFEREATSSHRQSKELMRPVLIERGRPVHEAQNIRSYTKLGGKEQLRETETLLQQAPIGSRIMWSNGYLQAHPHSGSTFTFENTIKLGEDSFGAHGFAFRKVFTREELEAKLAAEGKPADMSAETAAETYVFIEQIEIYSTQGDEPWARIAR